MSPNGVVTEIKDLVVLVAFDKDFPEIGEIVQVDNEAKTELLVERLEVHGQAMCLNVRSDKTLQRGMAVARTHHGIEIPLGDETIGRIFDALGQPLDNMPQIDLSKSGTKDILKLPPRSTNFTVQNQKF